MNHSAKKLKPSSLLHSVPINIMASSTLPYPNPRNATERAANFEASSKNIVGAVFVKNPRAWYIPVGLEYANDPRNPLPNYRPPFFGGTREYKNDEEGWTEVRNSRRRRRNRSRRITMSDM
jgi:hypothetical protein